MRYFGLILTLLSIKAYSLQPGVAPCPQFNNVSSEMTYELLEVNPDTREVMHSEITDEESGVTKVKTVLAKEGDDFGLECSHKYHLSAEGSEESQSEFSCKCTY